MPCSGINAMPIYKCYKSQSRSHWRVIHVQICIYLPCSLDLYLYCPIIIPFSKMSRSISERSVTRMLSQPLLDCWQMSFYFFCEARGEKPNCPHLGNGTLSHTLLSVFQWIGLLVAGVPRGLVWCALMVSIANRLASEWPHMECVWELRKCVLFILKLWHTNAARFSLVLFFCTADVWRDINECISLWASFFHVTVSRCVSASRFVAFKQRRLMNDQTCKETSKVSCIIKLVVFTFVCFRMFSSLFITQK